MTPAGTNLLLAHADAAPAPSDVVTKSLRFNDADNAYLSRTPSAGNRTTWTFSTWVKRAELGTRQIIFASRVSTARFYLEFTSGNIIEANQWTGLAYSLRLSTNAVYRDVGSWYHIVFKYDSTPSTPDSTSISLYVNGEQVTSFSTATYPSQNVTTSINAAAVHTIGERADLAGSNYDGYLADVNFIDGTALTPTSFAEEDATTGQWKPKAYSGSYGTNGFHLDFEDDTAIGNDVSGNNNNFTATNLAASDVVEDTPTDNYCVLNALQNTSSTTLSEGNLKSTWVSGSGFNEPATIGATSGKYYFEVYKPANASPNITANQEVGIARADTVSTTSLGAASANTVAYMANGSGGDTTGFLVYNGSTTAFGSRWDDAAYIIQCAFDADTGKVWFGRDNTWQDDTSGNTPDVAAGTYPAVTLSGDEALMPAIRAYGAYMVFNGGSDPTFAGYKSGGATSEFFYTPPTGFSALSTGNLATPTIAKPSEHFLPVIYTGASPSDKTVTGVGFQADLTWIKSRNQTYNHVLYDSVRTATEELYPNTTGVEVTDTDGLKSWNSDGFVVGGDGEVGDPTGTRISWNWKKSATAGFNIAGWTGDDDGFSGGTKAVAHGLGGVAPEMVIAKNRTNEAGGNGNWIVYHKDTTSGDLLKLNTTDGEFTPNSTLIGSIGPTNVSFGNDSVDYEYLNSDNSFGSGTPDTYIGYFFASVEGCSKVGSFSGSSTAFIYTGFRPAFILAKRYDMTGGNWLMFDDKREGYNVDNDDLMANSSAVEATTDHIDILSNGFKVRTSDADLNGGTLIYLAVAKNPFKYASAR